MPPTWTGAFNITYRFGPGFQTPGDIINLEVHTENTLKNVSNVIGTIKGSVEPDRVVLIGSHRDSWVKGAVDSVGGTSIMMELSRALGMMLRSGWRPRRTIKFCSWSAEEYALIGSTEYVEENFKVLSDRAVVYLNLDLAVCGNYTIRAYSSPMLNDLIRNVVGDVTDPYDRSRTLYDVMVERDSSSGSTKPNIRTLGAFSDYAPFYQYLGVPAIDYGYLFIDEKKLAFPYPVYHTLSDTYDWIKQHLDPDYELHLTIAKLTAKLLLRLSDKPLLPMNSVLDYAKVLNDSLEYIEKTFITVLQNKNISLEHLGNAVRSFTNYAKEFEAHLASYEGEEAYRKVRILNDQMMQVEKSFLHPGGLPGREQFKHLVFAPSLSNIYASARFPGITEALDQCQRNSSRCTEVKYQLSLVTLNTQQAARIMRPVLSREP